MYTFLKNLIGFFDNKSKDAHKTFLSTSRKITFKDGLYHSILKVINKEGAFPAGHRVSFDTGKKLTPQAICQSFQKVPSKFLSNINQDLIKNHFTNKNKRILLVDGTKISVSEKMTSYKNSSFPLTNTKSYRKGLMTFIYDLKQKVPICYNLVTLADERKAFLELEKQLKPGDILVFDRGYYSHQMIKMLTEKGYFILFRISKSNKRICSGSSEPPFGARTISYLINNQSYVFITNLPNQFTDQQIKDMYHSRWEIEEFYKFYKMSLGADFFNYKNENGLDQIIETQWMVSILIALICKKANNNINGFKRSPKYTIGYMEKVVYCLFYGSGGHLKKLANIFHHIWTTCLTKIVNNRSFPRIAIVNNGEWYRGRKATK